MAYPLGFAVTDANGNTKPVIAAWVHDSGTWKPVTEAWVYDSTAFKRFWPKQGAIQSFTGVLGTPSFSSLTLTWDTTFTTNVTLSRTSPNPATLSSSSAQDGNTTLSVVPGTTYGYALTVTDSLGLSTSKSAYVTTANVPAPTITSVVASPPAAGSSSSSTTITWSAVNGASYYALYNAATNTLLNSAILSNTITRDFVAGSTMSVYVKAVYTANSVDYSSAASATKTFTTPAGGPTPGAYTFKPATAGVYTTGTGWRDSTDNLYHGYYSSNRGTQTSMFFTYRDSSNRGFTNSYYNGATVTKTEIYVRRASSAGSSTPTFSRFIRHSYSSSPEPSKPTLATTYDDSTNALSYGEATWIVVPNSWGTSFLNGTYAGVGWGDVSSRYMMSDYTIANNASKTVPVGSIRITVS